MNIAAFGSSRKLVAEIVNRGTGAGGANTNLNGKAFEQKCNSEPILYDLGYTKNIIDAKTKTGYYLSKTLNNRYEIKYMKQCGLKKYIRFYHGSDQDINELNHPDECFIIDYHKNNIKSKMIIIEMKNQNVEGSCFDKLYNALYYKCLYKKIIGNYYDIYYHFVVSEFIENKIQKKQKFREILNEHNINIFNANSYREDIIKYIENLTENPLKERNE